MISTLAWLLVPVYLVLVAILSRWSARSPVRSPSCAQCGYDIAHAAEPRCSECGADLLSLGIVTPEMGWTPRPDRRGPAAALLMLPPAVLTSIFFAWVAFGIMRGSVTDERITIDVPQSGAYRAFIWEGTRTVRGERISFSRFCLSLEYADGTRSRALCVQPKSVVLDPAHRGRGTGGTRPPPILTEDDVPIERLQTWARDIGLDPDDPMIALELRDMQRAVRTLRSDGGTTAQPLSAFGGTTNAASTIRPTSRLPATLLGVLAGLLVLAAGAMASRRARRSTRIAQVEAARARFGVPGSPSARKR